MNSLISQDDLQTDLRRAVEEGAFEVHYQPIVELVERRVTGFEALVRWHHPEHGTISPGAFIPLAEELGLVADIGLWVLREACHQVRDWQRQEGLEGLTLSVNASGRQFGSVTAADDIIAIVEGTDFTPEKLEIEIVEGLLEDATIVANLEKLRDFGIQIHIDDFGVEAASPAHLRQFPVDAIKMDPSIVRNLVGSSEASDLAHAMIATAETLGMPVIAEAVETEEQLDRLRAFRCSHAQGYLFSRPLSPQGAMDFLMRGKGLADPLALSS